MSIFSPVVRIPKIDYTQIKRIQDRDGCSFRVAFEKWKKEMLGVRKEWRNI